MHPKFCSSADVKHTRWYVNTEQSSVHVVAKEHMIVVVVFLLTVIENIGVVLFLQVLPGGNQEAGRAAGRVTDRIIRLGVK